MDERDLLMLVMYSVAGGIYGYYTYCQGLKKGWDNLAYTLVDADIIDISDEGEITKK